MDTKKFKKVFVLAVAILAICTLSVPGVLAQPVPGGTLDPTTIPKYVQPLVIPPVMNNTGTANDYDIAVRQFQQQILPGGHWNAVAPECIANPGLCNLPATTVWSYGPAADPLPDSSGFPGGAVGLAPALNSQFNYPAYTVENTVNTWTTVDWINDLKEDFGTGDFLPYLIPGVVDQTLHWANPGADCIIGPARTDCRGKSQMPYEGPNPIITHVHGAHVNPESDGYPEAWYLPDPAGSGFTCVDDPANADPANDVYVCEGTIANQYGVADNTNVTPGVANFSYPNDQPSTTLWYHDHTLGMTRLNVYAGPAGFWLIRQNDGGEDGLGAASILPGPAPVAGDDPNFNAANRATIREIPIVIQDRSFNADGSLFYPANRAFFEGLGDGQVPSTPGNIDADLDIPFIPGDARGPSDIAPIWNPEAFFNVMVVNGVSWPELEVAPAIYRFRLLNGCNSRFLNLSMFRLNKQGRPNKEIPFFQIGAEQSLMPQVVEIVTGKATPLVPGVALWDRVNGPFKDQALLMGLAERADVLVDFRGLKNGDIVRMFNTAPDAPFGGFPDVPADPATSGQVMQFRVNSALLGQSPTDPVLADGVTPNLNAATDPWNVVLSPVENVDTYPGNLSTVTRDMALLEEESEDVCVSISPAGDITYIDLPLGTEPFDPVDPANACFAAGGVPFAPKAAVLGINGSQGPIAPIGQPGSTVTLWSDPIETNPASGATETWEMWNWSADAHPIHLHLVKFKVINREVIGVPTLVPPEADETGWKDTVIAYPGEVTRVAATFDIDGLYVWHCHIVEHEDNEMMVPYCVGDPNANGCAGLVATP
jgi:FtsP/CotA-like multicopper oxidase with cupredoxin domain